jgi:hypothetical protein
MLWMKWAHLCGAFYWSGSLLAITAALATAAVTAPQAASASALADLARALYRRGALPGLLLTLLGGAGMLWTTGFPSGGWMHAKLTLVLVLIIVDQIIRLQIPPAPGTSSTAVPPAEPPAPRPGLARGLRLALTALVAALLLLSVLRPF